RKPVIKAGSMPFFIGSKDAVGLIQSLLLEAKCMTEKEQLLDDFEHNHINEYELDHRYVETYDVAISHRYAKYGTKSLALRYHLGGWTSGNGAMYIGFKKSLMAIDHPLKIGLWVHGDGRVPWLRATLRDGR